MPVGQIVKRSADDAEQLAAMIFDVLDGVAGQEVADALILSMVLHIERTIPEEHRAEVAAGVAGALMDNFSN